MESLPVGQVAARVNDSLGACNRLVVSAPPGSGKSTLLPLTILERLPQGKIVMLEPRRAAARQIAMRMACMLGERVGETVGYRMRFDSRVSDATRIEVVTEGVMERMLVDDSTLDGIAAVIFDEFHERSITTDLTLALTLESQSIIRPDLRIVIMSATIDAGTLCDRLGAPLVEASGTLYDVEVRHGRDYEPADCAPEVARAVGLAYREQEGNILAFLPGQGEIARCAALLENSLPDALILPLHGMLPPEEQYRAIEYNPAGVRKVVLATPIAETSLTIEGIRTVVDSGLYKAVKYDISTGLSRLETERISLDMARQRAGRAGRLTEGVCYRLWSKASEFRMKESRVPEICDADLSAMILAIAAWGGADCVELPWITPPASGHVAEARRLLGMLGAVDSDGHITPHGRRMASLPCHPRIANMLLTATDASGRALAADIAALLEEKDPVNDENDADINNRIALLRQQRGRRAAGRWKRIADIARQYLRMVRTDEDNRPVEQSVTGRLLASAYPERVAMRLKDDVYRLPGGENVRLNEADNLSIHDFLAVATMGKRIFLASPVDKSTLESMASPHVNIVWSSREGRLIAREELRIGVLAVGARPIDNLDSGVIADVLSRAAVKDGRSMFDFNDNVTALQQRIATVSEWHPELGIPDVSTTALLASAAEWLPLYLGRATTRQELHRIDLCQVIQGIVGYELMGQIDRLAPTHVKLPCGRNARVEYRVGNPVPVVSARLQDCLGLYDTPRVDGGSRAVLMELLSPGFKPVQLTQDLRGFWSGTYFDVRKELRRRYPKHRWPDDPLNYCPE